MRRLRRAMAKAVMAKKGYGRINRCMRNNHWRNILGLKPMSKTDNSRFHLKRDKEIPSDFRGRGTKQRKTGHAPILLVY